MAKKIVTLVAAQEIVRGDLQYSKGEVVAELCCDERLSHVLIGDLMFGGVLKDAEHMPPEEYVKPEKVDAVPPSPADGGPPGLQSSHAGAAESGAAGPDAWRQVELAKAGLDPGLAGILRNAGIVTCGQAADKEAAGELLGVTGIGKKTHAAIIAAIAQLNA